ncbi:MAG: hypothetical protein ACLRLT_16965 [Sellimonas intestinalis]|uniref:hypothetical protein n=1 Tax=Sellimonas intestinalis TaxID=1653434 RepID=UPI0039A1D5CC
MMIQAVLSNPSHPEYGVATIPFPIPHDQYAHCMELLEALEIGDAVKADCKVEEVYSFFSVLKRTKMLTVNAEELNYLAKRLDSFDTGEAAQFQAMAHKLELFELKDLINLTFLLPAGYGHHRLFRPRRHRPRPLHEPARRQRKRG